MAKKIVQPLIPGGAGIKYAANTVVRMTVGGPPPVEITDWTAEFFNELAPLVREMFLSRIDFVPQAVLNVAYVDCSQTEARAKFSPFCKGKVAMQSSRRQDDDFLLLLENENDAVGIKMALT